MEQSIMDGQSKEEIIQYIISNYGEGIKRLIFSYVKNYSVTDDLFQEFLIKTYKSLDSFKNSEKAFKAWLYRIAINKCKDYLKSPLHRFHLLTEQWNVISSKSKTSEELLVEEERKQQVAHSILSLPVKYREILVLRYYRDLSIKEISESLKLNESTVKTRIQRAKEKLRTKLGGKNLELL
ncbi:sigma-70 family RNA polymerase sigma factor [Radiobacillus kanasensis]|uniref:sigma-70 family RNA polymerase sigma factor n=1 Tax=Radiobacillus kanasensis TaxID=2844358 RepID=UPI001E5685A1|nr:sigma-70 family RNA polymerase sigma factor [Radiobacillus kanasensis]UFT99054.1 sigma-70 family RNA polymerase sigma factor [Radiobacillus kanasensis]